MKGTWAPLKAGSQHCPALYSLIRQPLGALDPQGTLGHTEPGLPLSQCRLLEAGAWLLWPRLPAAASRGGRALWGPAEGRRGQAAPALLGADGSLAELLSQFCAGISSSAGRLLNGIFFPNAVIIAIQILITQSR